MFERLLTIGVAIAVLATLAVAVSGQRLFADAPDDPLGHTDAVVVLGGEHDGREQYGIDLAREIGASTVLLSDPYPADDAIMRRLCGSRSGPVEVLCEKPAPTTTRGEAEIARRIGQQRGWQRIAVVTWRYHLLRARMIFEQCYSPRRDAVTMRAVPRKYDFSAATWEYVYLYQYVGLLKAAALGDCGHSDDIGSEVR